MKKLLSILLIATLLLAFSSCTLSHIEDTNGDDKSLCTLTEEEILGNSTYVQTISSTSTRGNTITYKAKKMSGVNVMKKSIQPQGNTFVINSSITLNQGNLRVVVSCDGEIVCDIPLEKNQVTTIDNLGGKYDIRVAGESAEFEIVLELDY